MPLNGDCPLMEASPSYVRKRLAYRTQLAEPDPAQVSDLKISHGKLVKKKHGARGIFAIPWPFFLLLDWLTCRLNLNSSAKPYQLAVGIYTY